MCTELEKEFASRLSSILEKKAIATQKFAVAVSGGADSLALVFLMKNWADKNDSQIVALTVEHGLREDSLFEAEYVADLMKKNNIEHHILKWVGDKPQNNIEDEARIARYQLLSDFCKKNQIECLLLGHHKLDQVETFLMRLQRGSGLDGLSAMSEVSHMYEIILLRPLLSFHPDEFKKYLKSKKIEWKEDYLNDDDSFLRVRFRKAIPHLEELGFSIDRIYNTTMVLEKSRGYIESQAEKFLKNNVMFIGEKVARISSKLFSQQHDEIIFRVLSNILKKIGEKRYIPRALDVERICELIIAEQKVGCTLGGCEIFSNESYIWIIPELKDVKDVPKLEMDEFMKSNLAYSKIKMPHKVKKALYYQ